MLLKRKIMIFLNKKTNYLNKLQSNYYEFIGLICVIRKVKIQNIGLFFILVVLTSACSSPPQNHFAHLLTDGYKVESNLTNKAMVLGFIDENRASCIYGVSPNRRVWQRINTFYKMINREFHKLSMPVYVKSVEACPAGTSIFVFIHESFENPAEAIYREETKLRYFLKLDKPAVIKKRQGLASITRIKSAIPGTVFVKINQLSKLSSQHETYAKLVDSIVVEELFQAISNGSDIHKSSQRMSVLHEPARAQIPLPHPPDHSARSLDDPKFLSFFNTMLAAKPVGLCSYDVWFLVLADRAKKEGFIFYDQYLDYYEEHRDAIHKQAFTIENKAQYESLFDPRCTGENRGIKTKVGLTARSVSVSQ